MCNSACIEFAARSVAAEMVQGKDILEVGARDVNGTVRHGIEARGPARYTGVDIEAGPGVDEICRVEDLVHRFGADRFDAVVATELVEHVRDWRSAIQNMKVVLRSGGYLLLTTRSRGFKVHGYPYDYWRYEIDDLRGIFRDFEITSLERDPLSPGVFMLARKPADWAPVPLEQISLYSVVAGRRVTDVHRMQRRLFILKFRAHQLYRRLLPEAVRAPIKRHVKNLARWRRTTG